MASSLDDEPITSINVTPLVDIMLVLLVVLMITAGYVMAQTIPLDLPASGTGERTTTTLAISIDRAGAVYLDATPVSDVELRARVRRASAQGDCRATIAADRETSHGRVVHVIDLLRLEQVTKFSIDVQSEPEK